MVEFCKFLSTVKYQIQCMFKRLYIIMSIGGNNFRSSIVYMDSKSLSTPEVFLPPSITDENSTKKGTSFYECLPMYFCFIVFLNFINTKFSINTNQEKFTLLGMRENFQPTFHVSIQYFCYIFILSSNSHYKEQGFHIQQNFP